MKHQVQPSTERTLKAQDQPFQLTPHFQTQQHSVAGQFIKSAVYGGVDGIITTFNIAFSGFGAQSGVNVIVSLGVSSLLADGLAMGIADYISTHADAQYMEQEELREKAEIENDFQAQKFQLISIYKNMGISNNDSESIVSILSTNKKGFLDVMMLEQLKLLPGEQNPFLNSIITFFSFGIFGLIPLLPYIVTKASNLQHSDRYLMMSSGLLTAIFLFILGFSKSIIVMTKWYYSGIQTLIIGALSAAAAFAIGLAFGAQQI